MIGLDVNTRILDQSGRFDRLSDGLVKGTSGHVLVGTLDGPFGWSHLPARVNPRGEWGSEGWIRLQTRSGREIIGGALQKVLTQNGMVRMSDVECNRYKQERIALLTATPAFDGFASWTKAQGPVSDDPCAWFGLPERVLRDRVVAYMFEVNKNGSDRKSTLRVEGTVEQLRALQSILLHFGIDSGFQVKTDGRAMALGPKNGDQVSRERLLALNAGVVPQEAWKKLCFSIDSYAIDAPSDRLPLHSEDLRANIVDDITRCNADSRVGELDRYSLAKGLGGSVNLEKLRRLDVLTGGLDAWRYLWRDDFVWDSVVSKTSTPRQRVSLASVSVPGMPLAVVGDVIVGTDG